MLSSSPTLRGHGGRIMTSFLQSRMNGRMNAQTWTLIPCRLRPAQLFDMTEA